MMATRAPRPCIKPGCAHLSRDGTGYCHDHKPDSGWNDSRRGDRHQRGYGTAWTKLRLRILRRDKYQCQPCLKYGFYTEAKEVDHITPKSKGGTDSPDNLQAICKQCHRLKTQSEGGRGVKSSN